MGSNSVSNFIGTAFGCYCIKLDNSSKFKNPSDNENLDLINSRQLIHRPEQKRQNKNSIHQLDVKEKTLIEVILDKRDDIKRVFDCEIDTSFPSDQIEYIEKRPSFPFELKKFKYHCLICLRYFNRILVCKLINNGKKCGHSLCLYCACDTFQTAYKNKVENYQYKKNISPKCPMCGGNFNFRDIKENDEIKNYSSANYPNSPSNEYNRISNGQNTMDQFIQLHDEKNETRNSFLRIPIPRFEEKKIDSMNLGTLISSNERKNTITIEKTEPPLKGNLNFEEIKEDNLRSAQTICTDRSRKNTIRGNTFKH